MFRTINNRGSSRTLGKHSLMSLSMTHDEDKNNLKTAEEWIYGKANENGSKTIINFRSQKAFKGYRRNKVDLYKLFYLIYILIL